LRAAGRNLIVSVTEPIGRAAPPMRAGLGECQPMTETPKARRRVEPLRRARFAALALALMLGGCSWLGLGGEEPKAPEEPPEVLYNKAFDLMQTGKFRQASKMFDEVERQHPYSSWATQAQLMSAYAHYVNNEYDDAIIGLDHFIDLHPGHRSAPYAYYLKALCYYEQITDVGRDQKNTEEALNSLAEVVARFPNTDYARDASLKLDLTRDHLAGKEMEIGRYYETRGEYLAAINRFRTVIERYQTTTHVPEALHRLVECYLALGVNDEAQNAGAVLGYNFPGSDWYQDSYALLTGKNLQPEVKEGSWLSGTF
jgi:outer membrane protein assembly factor BamD